MIAPSWYPSARQLRQFAGISLLGFGVVGVVVLRASGSLRAAEVCWGIGVLLCLVGFPFPNAIRPVYALLMAVTLPIGWLVSNLFLRIIFYGVMTPLGLFFRLIGRDPLRIARPDVDSYWLEHRQRTDPAGYFRQA